MLYDVNSIRFHPSSKFFHNFITEGSLKILQAMVMVVGNMAKAMVMVAGNMTDTEMVEVRIRISYLSIFNI